MSPAPFVIGYPRITDSLGRPYTVMSNVLAECVEKNGNKIVVKYNVGASIDKHLVSTTLEWFSTAFPYIMFVESCPFKSCIIFNEKDLGPNTYGLCTFTKPIKIEISTHLHQNRIEWNSDIMSQISMYHEDLFRSNGSVSYFQDLYQKTSEHTTKLGTLIHELLHAFGFNHQPVEMNESAVYRFAHPGTAQIVTSRDFDMVGSHWSDGTYFSKMVKPVKWTIVIPKPENFPVGGTFTTAAPITTRESKTTTATARAPNTTSPKPKPKTTPLNHITTQKESGDELLDVLRNTDEESPEYDVVRRRYLEVVGDQLWGMLMKHLSDLLYFVKDVHVDNPFMNIQPMRNRRKIKRMIPFFAGDYGDVQYVNGTFEDEIIEEVYSPPIVLDSTSGKVNVFESPVYGSLEQVFSEDLREYNDEPFIVLKETPSLPKSILSNMLTSQRMSMVVSSAPVQK
jgi:hypothetical protein